MRDELSIFIPSRGRVLDQPSFQALSSAAIVVTLVVPTAEYEAYAQRWGRLGVMPCPMEGIADTRQWIMDNSPTDFVCMVDDDMEFFHRREDDRTKLRAIVPEELRKGFARMREYLKVHDVAHAGFACREGANRCTEDLMWNTRILRVLAYDRAKLNKEHITFGRMRVMEDFDVALRLLRAGYQNVILNNYAHNQRGSGAAGGCSTYRTMEVQAQAAHQLARLHPGFVRTVEKTTKGAWGGGTRTDVQISWKKAYASSQHGG